MADDEKTAAAVYVSWATFKNALDSLAQFTPNQIDRSTFPGMAWSVQNQLFTGLKFMGLMDDKGKPLPALQKVAVTDEAARKRELERILRDRYAELFKLDLTKTTPDQLKDEMQRVFTIKGDTSEKATRFFLSAVEYTGIPVSPLFKPKAAGNGVIAPRKRRPRVKSPTPGGPLVDDPADEPSPTPGSSRVIALKGGGTLTLSASVDILKLRGDDRLFVFDIIDKLNQYEEANPPAEDDGSDDDGGEADHE